MRPHSTNELERDIQSRILKYLRSRPRSFTIKLAAGPYSTPGVPDIVHFEAGKPFFFEVKRPGCKPTALQQETMKRIIEAGVSASVVYGIETVKDSLAMEGLPV